MGNFNPLIGKTQTISATTSSSGVTLSDDSGSIMLQNAGTSNGFYRTGPTSATAVATTDTPLLAGAIVVFGRPNGHNYVAAITGTGTATIYVTPGSGD